jgi:hypothetical protein
MGNIINIFARFFLVLIIAIFELDSDFYTYITWGEKHEKV